MSMFADMAEINLKLVYFILGSVCVFPLYMPHCGLREKLQHPASRTDHMNYSDLIQKTVILAFNAILQHFKQLA